MSVMSQKLQVRAKPCRKTHTPFVNIYFPLSFSQLMESTVAFGLQELIILSLKKGAVFLEGVALTWSFWDMLDMSMFRLLVQVRTFRVQKLNF